MKKQFTFILAFLTLMIVSLSTSKSFADDLLMHKSNPRLLKLTVPAKKATSYYLIKFAIHNYGLADASGKSRFGIKCFVVPNDGASGIVVNQDVGITLNLTMQNNPGLYMRISTGNYVSAELFILSYNEPSASDYISYELDDYKYNGLDIYPSSDIVHY